MFTGIVQFMGAVQKVQKSKQGARIFIKTDPRIIRGISEGGSVAIDGVCLTVIGQKKGVVEFELMNETLKRTTLGSFKVGRSVNVEPAMRAAQAIDGHFVSGHVDGVGRVQSVQMRGRTRYIIVTLAPPLRKYLVSQGSITVNGVSLTVVEVGRDSFSIALTPYTTAHTNLGVLTKGDAVNIETDMFAKYIFKLLNQYGPYKKISHRRGKV